MECDPHHDGRNFRAPRDLAIADVALRRILIVGSCLSEAMRESLQQHMPGGLAGCDHLHFNHYSQLPEAPSHPLTEYDFQIVQIPIRSIMPEIGYLRLSYDDVEGYERLLSDCKLRIRHLLANAMKFNKANGLLTFVFNFLVPQQNPMGRLLPRYDIRNMVHFVEVLNQTLAEEIAKYENSYLFDIDQIVASFGRKHFQDDILWVLAHGGQLFDNDFRSDQERLESLVPASQHYSLRGWLVHQAIAVELAAMYRTLRQVDMVKMVIVDLDDTLWRGVIAEETEITNEATQGWPEGFAESLLFLKKRGVLLAIASKNTQEKIEAVWDQIWRGRIKLEDFAIRKINWEPKPVNVGEAMREANLLPRNVVFIDDNPAERAAVKESYPDIRVLGSHIYYLRRIMLWSAETQVASVSNESARRTEMMQAQVQREEVRAQMSREEFLASLNIIVSNFEIDGVEHPKFKRAFELLNKSNQFNTTGKRWTLEEISEARGRGLRLYAFEVSDRFTQYGLVGLFMVTEGVIEQFVMSCRILGLDVEAQALNFAREQEAKRGMSYLIGRLVRTDANGVCQDVFQRLGFERENDDEWRLPIPTFADV